MGKHRYRQKKRNYPAFHYVRLLEARSTVTYRQYARPTNCWLRAKHFLNTPLHHKGSQVSDSLAVAPFVVIPYYDLYHLLANDGNVIVIDYG